jgi:hypothetical protein
LHRFPDPPFRWAFEIEGQPYASSEEILEKMLEEGDVLPRGGELGRDDLHRDRSTERPAIGVGLNLGQPETILEAETEERALDGFVPLLPDAEMLGLGKVKPVIIPFMEIGYRWGECRG